MPNLSRTSSLRLAIVLLATLPVGLTAACSSSSGGGGAGDDAGEASTTAEGGQGDDGGGSEASPGGNDASDAGSTSPETGTSDASDASSTTDAPGGDGGCNTVVNGGSLIASTNAGGSPPSLTGGTIPDGTYVLTAVVAYPVPEGGSFSTPVPWKETFVISANTANSVREFVYPDGGTTGEVRASFTVSTVGSTLNLSETCNTAMGLSGAPFQVNAPDSGPLTMEIQISNVLTTFTKQ
jgi:hypothetical protein